MMYFDWFPWVLCGLISLFHNYKELLNYEAYNKIDYYCTLVAACILIVALGPISILLDRLDRKKP